MGKCHLKKLLDNSQLAHQDNKVEILENSVEE